MGRHERARATVVPPAPVTVRRAGAADAAAIAGLLTHLGYRTTPEAAAARLDRLSERSEALVALTDGEVVGLATVHRTNVLEWDEPACRLMAMMVREDHRGLGVGAALVAASERLAAGWGCPRLELTSGNHRPAAHAFYRHMGYEETSRRFVKPLRPGVGLR